MYFMIFEQNILFYLLLFAMQKLHKLALLVN